MVGSISATKKECGGHCGATQGTDAAIPEIDPSLTSSSNVTSRAPISFGSTPPSAELVPLARVQKLEAQMATLLHHIHPRMQKSIVEVEEHIEKRVSKQAKQ